MLKPIKLKHLPEVRPMMEETPFDGRPLADFIRAGRFWRRYGTPKAALEHIKASGDSGGVEQ